MKKLIVIGGAGIGPVIRARLKEALIEVISIPEQSDVIEINSIKYRKRKLKPPKGNLNPQKHSKRFNELALMATMFTNMYNMGGGKSPRQRPDIDILLEYQLVLLKNSKLSRSDRDWVEVQFKNTYEEVP